MVCVALHPAGKTELSRVSTGYRPFPPPVTAPPARATAPSRRHVYVCPPLPVISAHRLGRAGPGWAALTEKPQLRFHFAAALTPLRRSTRDRSPPAPSSPAARTNAATSARRALTPPSAPT